MSASTLRGWDRRYGLSPSARTTGGHRRYTLADLDLLRRMRAGLLAGRSPAAAATWARSAPDPAAAQPDRPDRPTGEQGAVETPAVGGSGRRRPGGPGGRVLAVPRGRPQARGLARAGTALDVEAACSIIEAGLLRHGVARTWEHLVLPVLVAAGEHWARTGEGIEIEHVLSQATHEALRQHRRSLLAPRRRPEDPVAGTSPGAGSWAAAGTGEQVLLACTPGEQHWLPLDVLAAALAEVGVRSRILGPRVPVPALAAAVRRLRPAALFLWAARGPAPVRELQRTFPALRPPVSVVCGGPGWSGLELPTGWRAAGDLAEAVRELTATATGRPVADPPIT